MKKIDEKTYIDYNDIEGYVSSIARQITLDAWIPDYIVGLTRGGLLPATMLSHYFNVHSYALNCSLRDNGDMGPESNCWMAEDAFGYINSDHREDFNVASDPDLRKKILIVDDINDTGETLKWIMEDWKGGCMPHDPAWKEIWGNNVRVAVLVNNDASELKDPDYVGTYINKAEDPTWVVFPYEEWWIKNA